MDSDSDRPKCQTPSCNLLSMPNIPTHCHEHAIADGIIPKSARLCRTGACKINANFGPKSGPMISCLLHSKPGYISIREYCARNREERERKRLNKEVNPQRKSRVNRQKIISIRAKIINYLKSELDARHRKKIAVPESITAPEPIEEIPAFSLSPLGFAECEFPRSPIEEHKEELPNLFELEIPL